MVKALRTLATLVIAAGLLLVAPKPALAAGGVCGLGQTGNYITVSFTFNPSCGGGFGNNAANVVQDMYPLYTNFDACVWGLHPANWVFVGTTTYTAACGFGMYNVGPQARIAKVRAG
ncbi:hypothetical protein Prum_093150 [Phytohabitans rumicis]|uniref:Uncharacterized protein n=2 Tax=Phytohabitans rumicis TaxID=1076125 RepID=A0A6V8LEM0_9ACTN|nr:hypothetical protein Prum_093150 [Phytohabitans rumicis]